MKTPLLSSRRNHRYPYGLTFADAGKGSSLQPYKFGGKELDAMYGLNIYDFHARTQTPDLARFTRPDPLAEKTPHLSPYLFCANDPVNNTDPTGMDYYGVDDMGYFSLISINDDLNDRIYKLDSNSKPINDNFIDVDKDFMGCMYGKDIDLYSETYNFTSSVHININTTNSPTDKIFEFLVKNTNVEWSQVNSIDVNGIPQNYIGTSNNENMDGSMAYLANKLINNGSVIIDANHNHPNGSMVISKGDVSVAKLIQDVFPRASMKIFSPFEFDNPCQFNKNSNYGEFKEIIFEIQKLK